MMIVKSERTLLIQSNDWPSRADLKTSLKWKLLNSLQLWTQNQHERIDAVIGYKLKYLPLSFHSHPNITMLLDIYSPAFLLQIHLKSTPAPIKAQTAIIRASKLEQLEKHQLLPKY
jgi:hypothetical protein